MAKVLRPLFSLSAIGAFGKDLIVRRRGHSHVIERKPIPKDAKTSKQLAWRTMYQLAIGLWHDLSAAEQAAWESLARPRHMTGFAWFMSQCLRPNPGIYLPLTGGEMSGAIAMDGQRITDLPEPGAANDPARWGELTTLKALTTGIHGLGGLHSAGFHSAGQAVSKVVWKDVSTREVSSTNRNVSLGWTDLDLTAHTSANAKFALMKAYINVDAYTNGWSAIALRKNGTTPSYTPALFGSDTVGVAGRETLNIFIALDAGQVLEYGLTVSGVGQYDFYVDLLGYIE